MLLVHDLQPDPLRLLQPFSFLGQKCRCAILNTVNVQRKNMGACEHNQTVSGAVKCSQECDVGVKEGLMVG